MDAEGGTMHVMKNAWHILIKARCEFIQIIVFNALDAFSKFLVSLQDPARENKFTPHVSMIARTELLSPVDFSRKDFFHELLYFSSMC